MRRHVYYYTHIAQDFERAAALLSGDPGDWLPLPATLVDGEWRVIVQADGALPERVAAHEAAMRIGVAARHPEALLRGVTWRSTSAGPVVPVLEGDLELAPLNGTGCHLSLMGSYRPPLSVVGDAGDRLVGHRVAEACVRRFVLDVGDRLTAATLPV